MKRLLLLCFGIGMGSFLIGMENYYSYQWLPMGNQINVQDKNNKLHTYRFELPTYQEDNIAGKFFLNGEAAGEYDIIHEVQYNNAYLYTANYYPDETGTFSHWHLKQKDGTLFIMTDVGWTFPSRSERIEPFQQYVQSLKATKEKAHKWDWLTKTTPGKCISGIAALLALYGTGRLLWDTKPYWKKGRQYIFKLLKKGKRRKKHHHHAQEIS